MVYNHHNRNICNNLYSKVRKKVYLKVKLQEKMESPCKLYDSGTAYECSICHFWVDQIEAVRCWKCNAPHCEKCFLKKHKNELEISKINIQLSLPCHK